MSGVAGGSQNVNIRGKNSRYVDVSEDGHLVAAATFTIPKIFPLKRCLGKTTPLQLDNCPCAGFLIENLSEVNDIRWGGIGSDAPFIDATYVGDSKGNRIRPGQEKAIPLDNTNKVQLVGITNTEFQVTAYVNTLEDPQIDSQNPPEAIPPTVTLVSPANGATGVESNTNIVVTFSELVDPDTINSSTFTISPSLTLVRTINTSTGVSVVTATHATRFAPSTVYTVTLTTAITDFLGNPMVANYVFSFTTQAAPSVTTQFPANGAVSVAVDTLIYGIFSEDILAA